MKTILLIEDHSIVRIGVKLMLDSFVQPATVIETISFHDTLDTMHARHIDLVIMDIKGLRCEALILIGRMKSAQPHVRILVFSSQRAELYAKHCLKAGANGFLTKDASIEDFENAVQTVLNGDAYLNSTPQIHSGEGTLPKHDTKNPLETLSNRELEIMNMLLAGKWTKDIAVELNIKESTVSTYKGRIYEKLAVDNVLDLFKKVEIYRMNITSQLMLVIQFLVLT